MTSRVLARPFEKKRALKFALNRVKSFIIFAVIMFNAMFKTKYEVESRESDMSTGPATFS